MSWSYLTWITISIASFANNILRHEKFSAFFKLWNLPSKFTTINPFAYNLIISYYMLIIRRFKITDNTITAKVSLNFPSVINKYTEVSIFLDYIILGFYVSIVSTLDSVTLVILDHIMI